MVEPKLSLILVLPGSTMVSQQEAENKPKELTETNFLTIKSFDKKSKKFKKETIVFRTRKNTTVRQILKMSQEAYEAMLEDSTSPKYNKVIAKVKGKLIRVWDTMSEDARIKKHCELIAHDMGAIDFSYNILGD